MLLPPITRERAGRIVSAYPSAQVLVIGDVMLDKFIVGSVTRVSPEAPVPIVAFDHESYRLGGAANVAHNVAALGGQATLVGVTGQDHGGAALSEACREAGISPVLVGDAERPTTTKVRIVTERKQQVARIDYETDVEVAGELEQRVIAAIAQHASRASAIVVSDYLKGAVTRAVVETAIGIAAERGIGVFVDPKVPHIDRYAGATIVTPNHHEAEAATGRRIRSQEETRLAARAFRARARCGSVLMTRGDQGMWLLSDDAEGHLPATAREVADVTGAGDTVIAALALSQAAGATLAEAARIANEAAGLSVARFGPAVIAPEELLQALTIAAEV